MIAAAARVARHDADLDAVQLELLECELQHDHHGLGDVRLSGVALVDPVADRARLHRPANDVVEVDLAGDLIVDEEAELIRGAGAPIAVALLAPCGERTAIGHRVGLVDRAARFPHGEPVGVALADLAPGAEVVGGERTQDDTAAVEPHG